MYFPALTALRYNPSLVRFAARLRATGKPRMVIVATVMRKLVHQIYGVLSSGQPDDSGRAPGGWAPGATRTESTPPRTECIERRRPIALR